MSLEILKLRRKPNFEFAHQEPTDKNCKSVALTDLESLAAYKQTNETRNNDAMKLAK